MKKVTAFLILMVIRIAKGNQNSEELQKIPISWKPIGELAPNTVDGHLHNEVPVNMIGKLIGNIRSEHDLNKQKRNNYSLTINTKTCLDACKLNSTGMYVCMYDSYYIIRNSVSCMRTMNLRN